jgi:cytochrome P450
LPLLGGSRLLDGEHLNARLESRITEIIDGMLDAIERGADEFDGMQDYGAQLVVGALLTAMVNLDARAQEVFLAFHEVLPRTTYTKPGEPFAPECVRAFQRAADLVTQIIAERRARPRADFISDLIAARDLDPDVYPDPLRFDIHRNPKRIMAFGAGPHHCIGNILGRTTLVIAIRRLLARFPNARLADPHFVPTYGGAVGELRLQRLPMRIE